MPCCIAWDQNDGLTALWEVWGVANGDNIWQMLEAETEKYKQARVHSRCSKTPRWWSRRFPRLFFVRVQLLHNTMLVSAAQWSRSAACAPMSSLPRWPRCLPRSAQGAKLSYCVARKVPPSYHCTVYDAEDTEADWMSIDRWMDREGVGHSQWNITQPLQGMKLGHLQW